MYTIYHLQNKKVGVTNNIERRMKEQGHEDDYIVLAETNDLKEASTLEIYYQKQLGYKTDKNTYLETMNSKKNNQDWLHITSKSITFNGAYNNRMLKELLLAKAGENICFEDECIKLTPAVSHFIMLNNFSSQYENMGLYVYPKALSNFVKNQTGSTFDKIRDWAADRGILENGKSSVQFAKALEEVAELGMALATNDTEEIKDAIGDIVVVLTSVSHLNGFKIEEAIDSAYNVIKDRKGYLNAHGNFIKES